MEQHHLPGWPEAYVQMVPAGLPPALQQAMKRDADAISHAPNFWLPKERLMGPPPPDMTPVEGVIRHLLETHMSSRLPDSWQGAEFWVQVYKPGKGLAFHFDKDEALLVAEGTMSHPLVSSVLYLSGGCADGSVRQSPTMVVEQLFDAQERCPAPDPPQRCVLAYPLEGHYLTFDGCLGHGVLDSFSTGVRATLLVNWWSRQPQAVHELTDADVAKHSISRLAADNSGAAEVPTSSNTSSSTAERVAAEAAASSSGAAAEAVRHGLAAMGLQSQPGAGKAAAQASASGQKLPMVQLRVPRGCDEVTLLVDDMLQEAGFTLIGSRAVSLVAIEHTGYLLCPIDPEETAAATAEQAGGEAPQLQTAALLMHASLLDDESEDEHSGPVGDSDEAA